MTTRRSIANLERRARRSLTQPFVVVLLQRDGSPTEAICTRPARGIELPRSVVLYAHIGEDDAALARRAERDAPRLLA